MGGSTAHHTPEALKDIALWTLTRQPLQTQMRVCCSHVLHQGPSMPGRLIDRDHALRIRMGRRGPCHIPEVRCKGCLEPLLCALTGLRFAARWLCKHAGRALPMHHSERRQTLDLIRMIPRPHGGPMPLHAQRGPSRRHQGKAGCVLAPQDAPASLGFFLPPPALPAPRAAPRGRLAERGMSADTAGCQGADSSPASRCA
jgi:hypothetical protein